MPSYSGVALLHWIMFCIWLCTCRFGPMVYIFLFTIGSTFFWQRTSCPHSCFVRWNHNSEWKSLQALFRAHISSVSHSSFDRRQSREEELMAKLPLATMVLFLKWEPQLPLEHVAKGLHPTLLLQRQTPLPLDTCFANTSIVVLCRSSTRSIIISYCWFWVRLRQYAWPIGMPAPQTTYVKDN